MSGPSQRAAARRDARRGASTRPGGRTDGAPRTTSRAVDAAATRQRPNLTGRAVILASALALVVFTLAVPARELISQRAQINALQAANDAQSARVEALQVQQQRLQDPAYVTTLIRERLHYVLPGEVGYVVLDPSEAPAPSARKAGGAAAPWYATLWGSVRTTDASGVAPSTPKIIVRPNAPR